FGSGRLMSVPTGGGTPQVLASGLNTPTALAVDASGIYVGEAVCCDGRILKFDFAGNLVSVLARGLSGGSNLAVGSVNVYFINQAGSFSPLMSVPKSGVAAPLTLDPHGGFGSGIAQDGVNIYYSSTNISNNVELRKVPISGGVITPLASLGGNYANAI